MDNHSPRRGARRRTGITAALCLALGAALGPVPGAAQPTVRPAVAPEVLSFTADPRAPLTRFYLLLAPYVTPKDPEGEEVASVVEWRITDATGVPVYRTAAAAPPGAPQDLMLVPPGALQPHRRYTVDARRRVGRGPWSDWSPPFRVATERVDPDDLDGDGVADRAEAPPPHRRREPGEAVLFNESREGRPVTVKAESAHVARVTVVRPEEMDPAVRPPAGALPYGLFGVRVEAPEPGATVGLTFHLPEALPPGTRWLEVHPATGPERRPAPAVMAGRTMTVAVVDGGPGDADGLANGVVVTLAGPELPPPAPLAGPAPEAPPAGPVPVPVPAAEH
jgi:hypothetical protein